jgi:hypothetical protein
MGVEEFSDKFNEEERAMADKTMRPLCGFSGFLQEGF